MSPPIFFVLGLAIFFSVVSSVMVIVAVATDYWEVIDYHKDRLESLPISMNYSILLENEGFYQVAVETEDEEGNRGNLTYHYFRDMYGGIWKICDTISGMPIVIYFQKLLILAWSVAAQVGEKQV